MFGLIHDNMYLVDNLKPQINNIVMEEVWKPVLGYEGYYEVSNRGRVRSVDRDVNYVYGKRRVKGRVLKQETSNRGYKRVHVSANGVSKHLTVHREVSKAFIPNPEDKRTINHKNCDKTDNSVNNLEWATYSENHNHAHKNGLSNVPKGSKHHNSKLNESQVREIKKRLDTGDETQGEIAKDYPVTATSISTINTGKLWNHISI